MPLGSSKLLALYSLWCRRLALPYQRRVGYQANMKSLYSTGDRSTDVFHPCPRGPITREAMSALGFSFEAIPILIKQGRREKDKASEGGGGGSNP